ncbi:hypothetical protein LCGC14_1792540, partial [marine sediment metagenome]
MTDKSPVSYEVKKGIARITIDRPDAM